MCVLKAVVSRLVDGNWPIICWAQVREFAHDDAVVSSRCPTWWTPVSECPSCRSRRWSCTASNSGLGTVFCTRWNSSSALGICWEWFARSCELTEMPATLACLVHIPWLSMSPAKPKRTCILCHTQSKIWDLRS